MAEGPAYKKEELESVFTACIALSAMDGDISIEELKPVVEFMEVNWDQTYGDINQAVVTARDRATEILKAHSLKESLEDIASELSGSLDNAQRRAVLGLLERILHIDGEAHEFEHGLYGIFAKSFGLEH